MRTPEYELVAEAQKALQYGLHDVAERIFRLLEAGAWRHFEAPLRRIVDHETFAAFVTADEPDGLGTDVETVRRVCRDTPYALDAVDKALQGETGVHNVNTSERPTGNRKTSALRRLRKDRPDLHALVLAEQLSAHAAMIQAGFRHRTISVPIDDVDSIARALRRNLTLEQIAKLRKALADESKAVSDDEAWNAATAAEELERTTLTAVAERWDDVRKFVS